LPRDTTLTAFADVKYRCLWMLDGFVSTHPKIEGGERKRKKDIEREKQ
jgi:hypothetical protein